MREQATIESKTLIIITSLLAIGFSGAEIYLLFKRKQWDIILYGIGATFTASLLSYLISHPSREIISVPLPKPRSLQNQLGL